VEHHQVAQFAQAFGGPLPQIPPPPPADMHMPLTAAHLDRALNAFAAHVNNDLSKIKRAMDNDDLDLFDDFQGIDTLDAISSNNRNNKALGRQPPGNQSRKKVKFS